MKVKGRRRRLQRSRRGRESVDWAVTSNVEEQNISKDEKVEQESHKSEEERKQE